MPACQKPVGLSRESRLCTELLMLLDDALDGHLSSYSLFGGIMSTNSQSKLFTKLGFDPAYLPAYEDKLFLEGPQTARRLSNFFALLLFATVIATYGILSNSTATVIGAMLVAPLMGPMMATTAAVVMGSFPRALHALALTAAGIVSVIVFSYLLSWVVPDVTISFTSNAEITSRIHPGLYALLTALGAARPAPLLPPAPNSPRRLVALASLSRSCPRSAWSALR
jgi:hypothetical protein